MLGPVRFEHIKDCARDAIQQSIQEEERKMKRAKVGEDENRRQELIRVLPERDRSIAVLRDLLAEKQQRTGSQIADKGTSAKVPDYARLPLPTLVGLERAKDATIGWVLKQIEKAEAAQEEHSKNILPNFEGSGRNGNNKKTGNDGAPEALKATISP